MLNKQCNRRFIPQTILAIALGWFGSTSYAAQPATAPQAVLTGTPVPPEVQKWMQDNQYRMAVFIDSDSQTRVINGAGMDAETCGVLEGNKIPDSCGLAGMTPTSSTTINVLGYIPAKTPMALNTGTAKKTAVDPCTYILINGVLTKWCW